MCEPGERVLSDVHVNFPPSSQLLKEERATTRFYFRIPKSTNHQLDLSTKTRQADHEINAICTDTGLWADTENNMVSVSPGPPVGDDKELITMATVDEDGDLVVARRRRSSEECVIVIGHAMATTLNDVGLQVWQGCLLLCDFLLASREVFRDKVALELGAGLGLSSIVLAMMASHVFCTDVGTNILEMCQRNIANNCFQDETPKKPVVQVRELDWFQPAKNTNHSGPFHWDEQDREKLKKVTVIIAADVIYDDDLTDAFFHTLCHLMTVGKDKTAFIALEKRLNFTMDDLDVTCKAYDHYRRHIVRLASSQDADGVKYSAEQLPVDFPQCFQYKRTKQLELWKIKAVRTNIPPD